jgi:hypothetical protein
MSEINYGADFDEIIELLKEILKELKNLKSNK